MVLLLLVVVVLLVLRRLEVGLPLELVRVVGAGLELLVLARRRRPLVLAARAPRVADSGGRLLARDEQLLVLLLLLMVMQHAERRVRRLLVVGVVVVVVVVRVELLVVHGLGVLVRSSGRALLARDYWCRVFWIRWLARTIGWTAASGVLIQRRVRLGAVISMF